MDMTKVWQYIDDHREEYLALLEKFVAQPSISAQGVGLREMAQLVLEAQQALGISEYFILYFLAPIRYRRI